MRAAWLLLVIAIGCAKRPSAPPEVTCSDPEVQRRFSLALLAFADSSELAHRTPRISLPPVIAKMQESRREMLTMIVPPCARPARDASVRYMDEEIRVLGLFLGDTHYEVGPITASDLADLRAKLRTSAREAFGAGVKLPD